MARKKEKKENFIEEKDEALKPKVRTTSRTVEIETIKEKKAINYKKNRTILITCSIISFLLVVYIIYLVVMTFIGQ